MAVIVIVECHADPGCPGKPRVRSLDLVEPR